ncbi:gliding motility-associated C-terminal domain-containing protein [Mucilaginibacter pineti]|nr:gliding motility-associated C-terminal domain-containing protein [Mucilaginibacter pineti]
MFTALTVQAQVGDPIFKEDFGSGTAQIGPEISDPNFYTTYTYVPTTPQDGSYTIANSTSGMYTGAWLVTGDHTGNPGGYMMVAGANGSPDVFYKRTVTGLCPNTQYQFSAYLLNLMQFDGIKPNVTFTVTTSLGTFTKNTGFIDNGLGWQPYSITFTTPPTGGNITLQMTNSSSSGYGNDIALDDITFSPYGPTLKPGINNSSAPVSSCSAADNTYQLGVTIDPSGFHYTDPAYQWQVGNSTGWADIPGAINSTYQLHQPTAAGVYQYRLVSAEAANITSAQCRVASAPVTLTIKSTPIAQASVSGLSTICYGDNINLMASGGDTYNWTGPNEFTTSQQNPIIGNATEAMTGQYRVMVTTAGCPAWATVTLHINPKVTVAAGPNRQILHGQSVQLNGMATGEGITYHWTPSRYLSNPDILNPIATPEADITYTLHVISAAPCAMEIDSMVTISVYDKIVVPNTFSPNNDGVNDTWKIAALDTFPNSITQVFSRYGTLVFESKGYPRPWDGTSKNGKLSTGTYFYRIDLKNGKVYSGWVLLVD